MPIRPENRNRYPADWPEISARVRADAHDLCEWCGVVNKSWIRRGTARDGRALYRYAGQSAHDDGFDAEDGMPVPDTSEDTCDWGRTVQVVLTVAHLDHQPENCARENLKALCQRCHNRHDAPARRQGTWKRRRAAAAMGDLFQ